MRKVKLTRFLLPIPLLFIGGCDSWMRDVVRDEMASANNKIAVNMLSVRKMSSRLDQLEGHLAYCSDEVKKLLGKVQQECQSKDVCTPDDFNIPFEVLRIDPSKQGRFLSLFQERKHLAIYFPEKVRALSDAEKKNLRDLIKPTWLDDGERQTRFLVVSNLEDGSAASMQRASLRSTRVISTIAEISREMQAAGSASESSANTGSETSRSGAGSRLHGNVLYATNGLLSFPKERAAETASTASVQSARVKEVVRGGRVLNWIFSFYDPKEVLRPEDRPVKADDKLTRSVWVYRIDC